MVNFDSASVSDEKPKPQTHTFRYLEQDPDVEIRLSPYHKVLAHSHVLRFNSLFFERGLSRDWMRREEGSTERVQYIGVVDEEGEYLMLYDEWQRKHPNETYSGQWTSEAQIQSLLSLLQTFYRNPIRISSLEELSLILDMADLLVALETSSIHIQNAILNWADWPAVMVQHLDEAMGYAIRLQCTWLFRELFIHCVGVMQIDQAGVDIASLPRWSRELLHAKVVELQRRIMYVTSSVQWACTSGRLSRLPQYRTLYNMLCKAREDDTIPALTSGAWTKDFTSFATIKVLGKWVREHESPEHSWSLDQLGGAMEELRMLMKCNLRYSGRWRREEVASEYFTCTEVSDAEIPWTLEGRERERA